MINPHEIATQKRVIQLFKNLGYQYYGNWETRTNNVNVEENFLKEFLVSQGYSEAVIKKTIDEVNLLAHTITYTILKLPTEKYSLPQ